MSRLANAEKAGYFKIPASVTELLVTHMTAPQGGRILDPCAGEGTALVTFAEKLGEIEVADLLQETLDEEGHADQHLTRLALRKINAEATGAKV